jgi:adenylosuccinate lyase
VQLSAVLLVHLEMKGWANAAFQFQMDRTSYLLPFACPMMLEIKDAYRLVQRNAMAVWRDPARTQTALLDRLISDGEVTAFLSVDELKPLFDDAHHYRQVDTIFRRVFGRAS